MELPKVDRKKHPKSRAVRACVFTSNDFKKKEFQTFLGEQYGVQLQFADWGKNMTRQDIANHLSTIQYSPHYYLREETTLVNPINGQIIDGREVVENPEQAPLFLLHISKVDVWVPAWDEENKLKDLLENHFETSNPGYIDPTKKHLRDEATFGWDHMFVNPRTGRTNQECAVSKWTKTSARQIALSDFVGTYLFYKRPTALNHHKDLRPRKAVDFSGEMSVVKFVNNNPFFSNSNINKWFTKNMLSYAFSEGVFFKSSTSRPVKNYFSPPFGGVPLTPKKCDIEETVFMTHDIGHHLIPDLLVNFNPPAGPSSEIHTHVYVAWRMISEAVTMIFADMFYADSLVTTNPDLEKGVDRRIFGLWKVLKVGKEEGLGDEEKAEVMRKVWLGNILYAVLGDDSLFKEMIVEGEKGEEGLTFFKNHFEKFFIGDHNWTNKNYNNITNDFSSYPQWIDLVGEESFKKCHLFLLDDVVKDLQKRKADLSSFRSVVVSVFEYLFEIRLRPAMLYSPENLPKEEELTARGFLRFMVGNLSFYPKFYDLIGMPERFAAMKNVVLTSDFTKPEVRDQARFQFETDIRYVWSMGCISTVAAANCCSLTSIFPPFYIKYGYDEWPTTASIVKELYGC